MAGQQRSQPLPAKEESLLKQVMKLYDLKQYKKGIKTADQILKKHPAHGETLAFKSLIVSNYPERRQEAHDLAKAAIRADIKSHTCWHVYGLLHRADRDYPQAAKCYRQAMRIDPANLSICRDLCYIELQLRDTESLIATAEKVLRDKPNTRNHWMLLAVAHHLAGHHKVAVGVLQTYLSTVDGRAHLTHPERVEMSEIELYMATVMREGGVPADALRVLTAPHSHICDPVGRLEMQAAIQLEAGVHSEAEALYRKLIAILPDNYDYHHGLCAALSLDTSSGAPPPDGDALARLTGVYEELLEQYPTCAACKRIPLDFLAGDAFAAAARERMAAFVAKGVPSLFSDLKPLLRDAAKADALWRVAGELLEEAEGDTERAVWLHLYLAQHAAEAQRIGDAIAHIEAAAASGALGAAALDVYAARAAVLAAAGDATGAAAAAEVARRLDLKDRYVNSVAAKFWFRAGDPARAKETALLFAVDVDGTVNNLNEMQVMWFELESVRAHAAARDLGMALKMARAVVAHFEEFAEDQYDFHNYCLRKVTLRAYLDMLRLEDRLFEHEAYGAAAEAAVECYVRLHDEDRHGAVARAAEKALEGLSEEARKRAVDKRAKEAAKAAKGAAAETEKARLQHNSKRHAGKFDDDPKGEKLLDTKEPLAEADKLVQVLRKHAAHRVSTHRAAFAVAKRQDRPFLALQAVKRAHSLGADDPAAHELVAQLALWLQARCRGTGSDVADGVLAEELRELTGGKGCEELNKLYVDRAGGASLRARLAATRVQLLIDPDQPGAAAAHLTGCDLAALPHTHADAAEAYAWLRENAGETEHKGRFFAAAQAVHRWSAVFEGAERLPTPEEGLIERLQELSVGSNGSGAAIGDRVPTEAQEAEEAKA